ncbi:class I SAM-dependent methyltransferase [Rhizobium sp. C1]|uniref:class I SAM-dependent methyltransferase n=1 Tax=Rhizobium sp. C1 TaxID=1349799 RepID=UPI000BCD58FE|nr:methyltransferase domain-containing protein [Rhizobium sp. C1]MCD2177303.1 methyltransferase domain-containing protein [Rhizobium sp. C1]SOC83160.1 Predicted SAM-depedendent methyltransferase [Ensifer adhaerens]
MTDLLKLHIGCGKRYIPGFVHIDQVSFPHIDHLQDIRRLDSFEAKTASLIYACQVIEYFDREEVIEVLSEWRRVLAPGGILRVSVPNFKTMATLYQAGLPLEWFLGTLYGKIPDGEGGHIYHRTTYDEASLASVFVKAGFERPEIWDWRQTEHADVDDFSQAYFPHMEKERGILWNLNMQAYCPA